MLSFISTVQVLESWRTSASSTRESSTTSSSPSTPVAPPPRSPTTLPSAEPSSSSSSSAGPAATSASASAAASSAYSSLALDPFKIKKRMEEDRERRWVQPVSHNAPVGGAPLFAGFLPLTDEGDGVGELTLDIELENEWETTSDWNEDDDEAVAEENVLCFPPYGEYGEGDREAMDLS